MLAIGTDIVEIQRFKKVFNKKFLEKVYSLRELELYDNNHIKLASNFAAKEAVAKALGTGFTFSPNEIQIFRDDKGKPFVVLEGNAKQLAKEQNISTLHITISHSKEYVVAFCLGENDD